MPFPWSNAKEARLGAVKPVLRALGRAFSASKPPPRGGSALQRFSTRYVEKPVTRFAQRRGWAPTTADMLKARRNYTVVDAGRPARGIHGLDRLRELDNILADGNPGYFSGWIPRVMRPVSW